MNFDGKSLVLVSKYKLGTASRSKENLVVVSDQVFKIRAERGAEEEIVRAYAIGRQTSQVVVGSVGGVSQIVLVSALNHSPIASNIFI